tara:strand:- start:195 stop:1778 length:1584 start_codon:yes stop_codon:yes gene_type:complete
MCFSSSNREYSALTLMAYPLPPFSLLNFRRQSAPKFVSKNKKNGVTGKMEMFHDIENDSGYSYKVVTPPCNALYPKLSEGGNEGGMYSKTKQTSHIITHLLRAGDEKEFQSERDDFFTWLSDINDTCLQQMYDANVSGTAAAAREKTKKRYGKNKTEEELEAMSFKAFKRGAMTPLKVKNGEEQIVVKCRAYTRDLAPRAIRYVQTVGNKYVEMDERPDIRNGALLSCVFQVRQFSMSKDKYGLTYSLTPDIVVYTTGNGRAAAPIEDIETQGRPYVLSDSEGKDGRRYLNINDNEKRKYAVRPPAMAVVFGDSLTGTGTLGNISGVTEASAKYTAVTKENQDDPASVAFFDFMSKMSDDVIAYAAQSPDMLQKLKAESEDEAKEMAEDTGKTFEECFDIILREAFNSPVNKREQDEYRQLRFSQNVYSKTGVQNTLPMVDADGAPVVGDINRGAMIAPVLTPSVYFMADGKFGLKLAISLDHGIRVDSNPEASAGSAGVLYAFKRARDDTSETDEAEPTAKRSRSN